MFVVQASKYRAEETESRVLRALDVSIDWLRNAVEAIAYPRHYVEQAADNQRAAEWVTRQLRGFGYETQFQGDFRNIVTVPVAEGPLTLIGAHYDSKPQTPGADDNASAVAALLATANAISEHAPQTPVVFVAFNREEDNLLGSTDFVQNYLPSSGLDIRDVHVLEMLGYRDSLPGSQRLPSGLPIRLGHDRGDFLAVLGNRRSIKLVDSLMRCATSYVPELSVLGLKIWCGLENQVRHLRRSDHAPFWKAGIPALMWTDTAEFRNPNYHQPTDTPDTLDYEFLRSVTQLLIAHTIQRAER